MDRIGIDVHKNASQVCIRAETGRLLERQVRTDRDSFATWLGKRDKARILVESSTESERVARCLEELGHEVIVANPNFAAMYAQRSRKVKTDRRDARALCEACELGAEDLPGRQIGVGEGAAIRDRGIEGGIIRDR